MQARQLRNAADAQEARQRSKESQRTRNRLIRDLALRAARGVPDDEIIAAMVRHLDLSPDDACALLRDERSKSRATLRAIRDREILRLAWTGKTNAEIGRRVDLSEKHVSRIVASRLRAFDRYQRERPC